MIFQSIWKSSPKCQILFRKSKFVKSFIFFKVIFLQGSNYLTIDISISWRFYQSKLETKLHFLLKTFLKKEPFFVEIFFSTYQKM
jgi:hypothetical protein